MHLIRTIGAAGRHPESGQRVLAIGAFDGLHIGHQAILQRASQLAAVQGDRVSVLSFEPTPAEYFARSEPPARLTCFRERFELLERIGIDELVCPRFASVIDLDARQFVDRILRAQLHVSHVVVGHDFRYGAGRRGDVASLQAAGARDGFGVTVVDAIDLDNERVSSTAIRAALQNAQLQQAARMLGRDYSMSGRIVHGRGLGRQLGFPTANVNLKRRRAPLDGIFAVQVDGLGPEPLDGVASIGNRPTVGGGETLLEVNLFDFEQAVYGRYITVRFRKRLRSEKKFPTLAAMQAQMHVDVAAAKAALAG